MSEADNRGTLAVGERDGMVIITFPQMTNYITLDPETARQVGEALAREAYYCHYGIKPDEKTSTISSEKRSVLVARMMHMMKSFEELQKSPRRIAEEAVDIVLTEVL